MTTETEDPDTETTTCDGCGIGKTTTADGKIRRHTIKKVPCPGGGILPREQGGRAIRDEVHCRECGDVAELTPNGRVRTHLAIDGEGNCPGGSDFPAEHYPETQLGAGGPDVTTDRSGDPEYPEESPFEADGGSMAGSGTPDHVHRFEWADDGAGHSGSVCMCGLEEPEPHEHSFTWSGTRNASVCTVNGCDQTDSAQQKAERFQNGGGATKSEPRVGKPSDDVRRAAERSRTTTSADDEAAAFLNGGGPKLDSTPGPWFKARFDQDCDTCGDSILEGDDVRADGVGGWECEQHRDDDEETEAPRAPAHPADGKVRSTKAHRDIEGQVNSRKDDEAAAFLGTGGGAAFAGAPPVASSDDDVAAFLLAGAGTEDDKADRYGRWGQYKINHPDTGKQQLWQRATTAAKTIASTFSLNQWHQRMTAKGLTMRDDLLLRAASMDVKRDREELNKLCEEAQVAAGSKISAELGTALHAITERLDLGQEDTLVPPKFRALVDTYLDTVKTSGLKIVPGMMEQTTALTQYMVAGTFDRIFQLPNGEYVIGDLKTGDDLSYGEMEIEIQLAIYAYGVNTHGIWDWKSKTWVDPGFKVRPDLGVVMHLPASSVLKGGPKCQLYWVNLKTGWANLALAKSVEGARKPKKRFRPFSTVDVTPYSGNVEIKASQPKADHPDCPTCGHLLDRHFMKQDCSTGSECGVCQEAAEIQRTQVTVPAVKTPGHGGSTRPKGPCPKCTLTVSLKLDGEPYDHVCVPQGASEEEQFLNGPARGPSESGPEKMARVQALFDACTTKKEASQVYRDVKNQLPPAALKAITDKTLARLEAAPPRSDVATERDLAPSEMRSLDPSEMRSLDPAERGEWRTPKDLLDQMPREIQDQAAAEPDCGSCYHPITPLVEQFAPDGTPKKIVWGCKLNCRTHECRPSTRVKSCEACNTDTHSCPGCGESVPHGTVVCTECDFRIRFEEVATKEEAQKLWQKAKEILPKEKLGPMVAQAAARLKAEQEARKAAAEAPPKEPTWAERFDAVTTKQAATELWKQAKAVLTKAELDPLVKKTLARLS